MSNFRESETGMLDIELCKSLAEILHKLTHTSNCVLDEALLKNIKQIICSHDAEGSSPYLQRSFEILLDLLKKPHSEIRYNTLQTMRYLHQTFQYFQNLVESKLKEIVELTTGVNNIPLPPPGATAREMKRLMLRTIQQWYEKYGSSSKIVQEYYDYLVRVKKVDFQTLEILDEKTIALRKEREKRERMVNEENMRIISKQIEEFMPEITNAKQILENSLNLLIPSLDNFEVNEFPSDIVPDVSNSSLIEIEIQVDNQNMIKIEENDENEIIIENARDQYALLNKKYMVKVQKWIKAITNISGDPVLLKRIIDLKDELQLIINKYKTLKFVRRPDSDSDMEEVACMNADDLISQSIVNSLSESTSKDLEINNESNIRTEKEVNNESKSNAEIFECTKGQCRAPLPKGGICPRRDKYKCPFHGKIVPRDENGKCINSNDEKSNKNETPDWQDPKLLAELKKSTGVDLTMPKKGQKRKKDGPPPLTDIKTKTPRQRLYDKLFRKTKKNAL